MIAAAATTLAVVSLLAVRGEFRPYIDTTMMNVFYSAGRPRWRKDRTCFVAAHINRVGDIRLSTEVIVIVLAIMVALIPLSRPHPPISIISPSREAVF